MGVAQFAAGQRLRAQDINQLPVVVSYLTTGSVANTTTETVIGSFTIPAGDPTFPGGYFFKILTTAAEAGSPTLIVRVRFGSVSGASIANNSGPGTFTTGTTTIGHDGWMIFSAIGASGSFGSMCTSATNLSGTNDVVTAALSGVAIDTTVSNLLVVTAKFGTASPSNTCTTVGGAMYRL